MKRILSIALAMMLGMSAVNACKKKSSLPPAPDGQPLTVIVMDTTQALLSDALVKIGRDTYKTSFDGRIILQPEQLTSSALVVTCEGYKASGSLPISHNPMIVKLIPEKSKTGNSGKFVTATRRGDALAKRGAVYEMADVRMMTTAGYAEEAAEAATYSTPYMASDEEAPRILPDLEGRPVYGGANNVSAGTLTAGEVNDFTKWELWPIVMDSTHKQFIRTWQMEPRHRYTVQVVDKHGYPIVNHPVSLMDKSGNTVFQAITDNTGKAELWNGLFGAPAEVDQPAWQTVVLDEAECALPATVDVMFVFDATGSMGDELFYLQAEMNDVIARATDATGGLKIRTGAVVYRDHGDDYVTRISRLTENLPTTQSFIDKQQANGGGDYPEAVPEALMAALNSAGWDANARARIAFLILDAPCHEDSVTLALLHEQVLNAAALGVRLVPVVCSGLGESGEYMLRSMALATNGTSFFLTDDSGVGQPHLTPTTDSLKVEHLNDMLVRTIVEFSYMPDCTGHWHEEQIEQIEEQFIPNPFSAQEIEQDPSIPHGPTTLYLLDVSGKLIQIYNGNLSEASDSQLADLHIYLSTGVYFVKAFYDGEWHTRKILVH